MSPTGPRARATRTRCAGGRTRIDIGTLKRCYPFLSLFYSILHQKYPCPNPCPYPCSNHVPTLVPTPVPPIEIHALALSGTARILPVPLHPLISSAPPTPVNYRYLARSGITRRTHDDLTSTRGRGAWIGAQRGPTRRPVPGSALGRVPGRGMIPGCTAPPSGRSPPPRGDARTNRPASGGP